MKSFYHIYDMSSFHNQSLLFTEHLHQIVDIGAGKRSKDAALALQSLCLQDALGILRDILHGAFRWEQDDPPKLWAPAAEIPQSSWHPLCILREIQFEHLETEMARISPMITSWHSWHVKLLNHYVALWASDQLVESMLLQTSQDLQCFRKRVWIHLLPQLP